MKLTFLGTSSGAPSRTRNVSAIGLQLIQQGRLWLFDCGEGTQHQVMRSQLKLSHLDRIFITHLHGDHVFGLPGLLASRSLQAGGTDPVTIHGPAGLGDFLKYTLERTQTRLAYPIHLEVVRGESVYEDAHYKVLCKPLMHRIECYGYAVVEKDQAGHFDVEGARALGVPEGPLYGRLKRGETIALDNGTVVDGSTLVGGPRQGRRVVYTGDTVENPNTIALAQSADVLIHEATYADEDAGLAARGAHSTSSAAARVAQSAGVKTLILTHFSTRYDAESSVGLPALLSQAQSIHPNTILARDLWSYEVARPSS